MSDVRKEFQSHALTPEGQRCADEVARLYSQLLDKLEQIGAPDAIAALGGRPFALCITKLQESKMWATRAIAENPAYQAKEG